MRNCSVSLLLVAALLLVYSAAFAENWSAWHATNAIDVSYSDCQVDKNTWTWRFRNDGAERITDMEFDYHDSSGTHHDVLPRTLKPGEVVGGWSAFTATSEPSITITKIKWGSSDGFGLGAS